MIKPLVAGFSEVATDPGEVVGMRVGVDSSGEAVSEGSGRLTTVPSTWAAISGAAGSGLQADSDTTRNGISKIKRVHRRALVFILLSSFLPLFLRRSRSGFLFPKNDRVKRLESP
jgi:hypothetical protein